MAFLTGTTPSSNFPITLGAYSPSYNDNGDAYLVSFNFSNNLLSYSTFIGSYYYFSFR